MNWTLYTDGAAKVEPDKGKGRGGYGAIAFTDMQEKNKIHVTGKPTILVTNSDMEVAAVLAGIALILRNDKNPENIHLITDSAYVSNSLNFWIKNWKKNNWRNSKNQLVSQYEMWNMIDSIITSNNINFTTERVKGHNGNIFNEQCDILASNTASGTMVPTFYGSTFEDYTGVYAYLEE